VKCDLNWVPYPLGGVAPSFFPDGISVLLASFKPHDKPTMRELSFIPLTPERMKISRLDVPVVETLRVLAPFRSSTKVSGRTSDVLTRFVHSEHGPKTGTVHVTSHGYTVTPMPREGLDVAPANEAQLSCPHLTMLTQFSFLPLLVEDPFPSKMRRPLPLEHWFGPRVLSFAHTIGLRVFLLMLRRILW